MCSEAGLKSSIEEQVISDGTKRPLLFRKVALLSAVKTGLEINLTFPSYCMWLSAATHVYHPPFCIIIAPAVSYWASWKLQILSSVTACTVIVTSIASLDSIHTIEPVVFFITSPRVIKICFFSCSSRPVIKPLLI